MCFPMKDYRDVQRLRLLFVYSVSLFGDHLLFTFLLFLPCPLISHELPLSTFSPVYSSTFSIFLNVSMLSLLCDRFPAMIKDLISVGNETFVLQSPIASHHNISKIFICFGFRTRGQPGKITQSSTIGYRTRFPLLIFCRW